MSAEPVTSIVNGLSVDLEDWYQGLTSTNRQLDRWPEFEDRVVPATERVLELLRQHNAQATFFALGYVARMHPDLLARIAADGHELALHGFSHRRVDQLTPAGFRQELERGLDALADAAGQRPVGHRAPYFSVNRKSLWALDVLAQYGFRYDASMFPTRNMLYGFPDAPRLPVRLQPTGLVEFPASTVRIGPATLPIAGGFYVRALPAAWIAWGIRRLNSQGHPAILYLHPWELDPEHPTPSCVTARERLTHYTGLHTAAAKWQLLLGQFQFAPLCTLVDTVRVTATHPRGVPLHKRP
jgi:polysaccharide deacetylase family protein (PEP-CTERM system associated)